MNRFKVTDHIEYVIPDDEIARFLCSGVIVRDRATVFLDINLGEAETRVLLETEKPEFGLTSHYHLDHSLGGAYILEYSSAEFFVPSPEAKYLKDLDYFFARTGGEDPFFNHWKGFVKRRIGFEGFKGFSTYDRSLRLNTGTVKMEFLMAPGHSPGHTTVHFPGQGILFTGDLGLGPFGPWYGFEDCDIRQFIQTILELKSMRPKFLLTSHNGIIRENIDMAFDRCIDAFFIRESAIRKKLEWGLSKDEIVEEGIYFRNKEKMQGPLRLFLPMWDSVMFDLHREIIMDGGLEKDFPGLRRQKE
jgi:hydroxyacylglutathione hydrolase